MLRDLAEHKPHQQLQTGVSATFPASCRETQIELVRHI